MKIKSILITSILLNILGLALTTAFIQHKGGLSWVESKLPFIEKKYQQVPKLPLPSVDGRILMIGDSHLAIHPWSEYSTLPFSNRAVSGSRIKDINVDTIKGYPYLVIVSTSTNDIQERGPSRTEEIKTFLKDLFLSIKNRWPESIIVYVSAPYPNVELYEKYIRAKHPKINRPMPDQIDKIRDFVSSLGIITIQAKSANIDGLHIDIDSAIAITNKAEKIFANKSFHRTR